MRKALFHTTWLRLIAFAFVAVSFAFLGGCRQGETIKEWREVLRERESDHQIVAWEAPTLAECTVGGFPLSVNMTLQQRRQEKFTLAQTHCQIDVRRAILVEGNFAKGVREAADQGLLLPIIAVGVATAPIWTPFAIADDMKAVAEAKKAITPEWQQDQIDRLLRAWDRTTKPVMRFVPVHNGRITYWLYSSRARTTTEPNKLRWKSVPAAVPVRVRYDRRERTASANQHGQAELVLFDRRADLQTAAPGEVAIEAFWDDRWVNVGRVDLTTDVLAASMKEASEYAMAATGTPHLPPRAKVTLDVPAAVTADEDALVSVTVANVGKGDFYRLGAVMESADPVFDGLTFAFGKLVPGETLTLRETVHVPRGHKTSDATFRLTWSEYNDYLPDEAVARTVIRGLDRPAFAVAVQVVDDNSGNSVGNGDGRIQKGEAVDLLLTVKNVGDGSATNASVTLEGLSDVAGVVVNEPRADLGDLAPGESAQGRLTVTTKKTASVTKLTPVVRLAETNLGVTRNETLSIAMDQAAPEPIMAYEAKMYVGGDDAVVRAGAGDDTAVLARASAGTPIRVTGELGRWRRVRLDGVEVGWIEQSQLTAAAPAEATPAAQTGGGVVTVLQNRGPMIVLSQPAAGRTVTRPKTTIRGVAADDQGIARVRILLNGSEVISPTGQKAIGVIGPDDQSEGQPRREMEFAAAALLQPGANEIEITAWDTDGLAETKTRTLIYNEPTGQVHLVSIGINAYEHIPTLNYAAADARAVAACLQQRLAIPDANVQLLVDADATKRNIERALGDTLRGKAARDDTVIIYFSGHGAPEADPHSPDRDGIEKYLLPVDAEKDALYSTAVPMDDICRIFQRIDSERVVFLADSCYSGRVRGQSLTLGRQYRNIDQGQLLKRLQQTGKGRVVITASAADEVSQEDASYGHGVFTYHLLRGLEGAADSNTDGEVTVFELFAHVNREVPRATRNRQHPKAKMEDTDGNIVLSFTPTAK